MPSIHFHDADAKTLFGLLTAAGVRVLFEMEEPDDLEIPGLEGWVERGGHLYYAHEVGGEIHISVIQ